MRSFFIKIIECLREISLSMGKIFLKLAKLQKTKEEMTSYYKSNTKDLTTLREKFPKIKEMLDGELKSIVNSLKEV